MAHSFDGSTYDPLSDGSSIYPVWSKAGIAVVKKIPGGSKNVIQKIGVGLPRMALPIKGTRAQMDALLGKVGDSGTLIFPYETCVARLESMEPPTSIGIGNDLYTSVLNLIRTASVSTVSSTAFITEGGDAFITEASETLIQE
jgi:hypothetical protein